MPADVTTWPPRLVTSACRRAVRDLTRPVKRIVGVCEEAESADVGGTFSWSSSSLGVMDDNGAACDYST